MISIRRFGAMVSVCAAAAVFAVGCGDDDTSSESGSTPAPAATEPAGGDVAAFDTQVAEAIAAATEEDPARPPTEGPPAAADKKVYVISCGNQISGCAKGAEGAEAAAKDLGWDVTVIDTQGDPSKASAGIQKAIADKADGIQINAFDAGTVGAQVKQAVDAGIVVTATNAVDEPGVFSSLIPDPKAFEDEGYLMGQQLYQLADKDLKMIVLSDDEFGVVKARRVGTERFVEDCKAAGGKCEIVAEKALLAAQLAEQAPRDAVALKRSNPEANVIWGGFDAIPLLAIPAVKQAGFDDVIMNGFDALPENLDIIKSGGIQKASTVLPLEWVAYASMDNMNRLFAGEEPVDFEPTPRIANEDNPDPTTFDGFVEAYRTIWNG